MKHIIGYWMFVFYQFFLLAKGMPWAAVVSITVNAALLVFTDWFVYLFCGWYLIAWISYIFSPTLRRSCYYHVQALRDYAYTRKDYYHHA